MGNCLQLPTGSTGEWNQEEHHSVLGDWLWQDFDCHNASKELCSYTPQAFTFHCGFPSAKSSPGHSSMICSLSPSLYLLLQITNIFVFLLLLYFQQADAVKMHTDLKVGTYWGSMGVDFWNADMWKEEVEKYEVRYLCSQYN